MVFKPYFNFYMLPKYYSNRILLDNKLVKFYNLLCFCKCIFQDSKINAYKIKNK